MAFVPTINSTSHVPDTQDWIRYYVTKDVNETVPNECLNNVVTKAIVKVDIKQPTTGKLVHVESSEKIENIEMGDVELVSPVQGAVQQARAEYERADPIKRRTGIRRHTKKKVRARGRKHPKRRRKKPKKKQKKKKKSKKKGKRLKKKVHKKKVTRKKRKKRVKKRDIFTD